MKNQNLEDISKQILELEEQCTKGINVSENLEKMEKIMMDLPLDKLFELIEKIENFS